MNYEELKAQTFSMPEGQQHVYRDLLSLVSIGGAVRSKYSQLLASAATLVDFYEAIYADDSLAFDAAWALWAKEKSKHWETRFTYKRVINKLLLDGKGAGLVTPDGSEVLIPMHARLRYIDLYLFEDGGFNEQAAQFFTTIDGAFTCCGMSLNGTYDIFTAPSSIIFEEWSFDKRGKRNDWATQSLMSPFK